MARMYPQSLPLDIMASVSRATEVKVYKALETLPDDYIVLFSLSLLKQGSNNQNYEYLPAALGRPADRPYPIGELDFVVIDPAFGFIVIEVKGGRVKLIDGTWYSFDRGDVPHIINDPLQQSKKNMFALLEELKEMPRFRTYRFRAGYGAILPDTVSPQRDFGIGAPLALFGFVDDLSEPQRMIGRFSGNWRNIWENHAFSELNSNKIETIIQALAPTVELKRPPLGFYIREYEADIIKLTEDQYRLLQYLTQIRKALVSGGAGTGKTMLAFEKARRLADQGYRTLFTCPNRFLADQLSAQAKDTDNLQVINFHQLCYQWGQLAGIDDLVDPDGPMQATLPQVYYDQTLPEALLQAHDIVETRFDAVIVDEGQDMRSDWWELLELCMSNPEEGYFYIFYDQNQNIWYKDARLPFKQEPFTLVENLRNNKKIHRVLKSFFEGHDYEAGGPEGGDINYIFIEGYEDCKLEQKLEELLHQLIQVEKIQPCDIAILTGTSKRMSILK